MRRGNRHSHGPVAGNDRPLAVDYRLDRRASVKDVIECLGPPHTEIGAIEVDGEAVDFGRLLVPDSPHAPVVDVHPVIPPLDVTRPSLLRPIPLPRAGFVVDVNVGRLARWLRLLGLDAAHDPSWSDRRMARLAADTGRAVLTGDFQLLKRSAVTHGRLVRSVHPQDQLLEVLDFFGLTPPFALFTRCLDCNGLLRPVPKNEILHRLEPLTKKYFSEFSICGSCSRVYWRGSHHSRMLRALESLGLTGLGPAH